MSACRQASILRGRRYNRTKKAQGGTGANQHKQKLQNDTSADTASALAETMWVCQKMTKAHTTRGFADEEEAKDWIDANQLGRRNLTPDTFKLILGRRYNRQKKNDGQRGPKKLDQNEPASTAERLAAEHHVSPATVKRAGEFASAVETVRAEEPDTVKKGEARGQPKLLAGVPLVPTRDAHRVKTKRPPPF